VATDMELRAIFIRRCAALLDMVALRKSRITFCFRASSASYALSFFVFHRTLSVNSSKK